MSTISNLPQPLFDLIGVVGFVLYMLAYGLLQIGRISGQSYSYTLMNMVAATLVLISLVNQFNLASLLIQVSWIAISVVGLYRLRTARHTRRSRPRFRVGTHNYAERFVSARNGHTVHIKLR